MSKQPIVYRQAPNELLVKVDGGVATILPWHINQVVISREYFHAWLYEKIGDKVPMAGNKISSIKVTDEGIEITFED